MASLERHIGSKCSSLFAQFNSDVEKSLKNIASCGQYYISFFFTTNVADKTARKSAHRNPFQLSQGTLTEGEGSVQLTSSLR